MKRFETTLASLRARPRRWLLTGAAGFIGSHLVETLLGADQVVVGLDNLSSGRRENLEDVLTRVTPAQRERFRFHEEDITDAAAVARAMVGVEVVLHQAALGSVPRSIEEPGVTHEINVTGALNVLVAARDARVSRVVYASSSAVYGDCEELPAREDRIGRPLSPYAVSKAINEQYAAVFERCYGLVSVGLRYFNVCGPRQDPAGAYAAVIPRWTAALLAGRDVEIYGDGGTSRDFCPVTNVVAANLRAAIAELPAGAPRVFNVGLGEATNLNRLFEMLRSAAGGLHAPARNARARTAEARPGEVRHSCADLTAAERWLGFGAVVPLEQGLEETVRWFAADPARLVVAKDKAC